MLVLTQVSESGARTLAVLDGQAVPGGLGARQGVSGWEIGEATDASWMRVLTVTEDDGCIDNMRELRSGQYATA
jgi:hypothetical protein